MESYGYAGKILRVDLTTAKVESEELDRDLAGRFIGGWGLNAKLAYDHTKPGIDPLSPETPIVIGAGLLGGTLCPSSPKAFVTTKCPSAGTVTTAVGSLNLSATLRWAGYDHVIITGKAEKPVYLKIVDDDVEICDASDLWGKDLVAATDELRNRHGGTCSIVCIGPAGERMLKTAIVLINKLSSFGRTLGGNMGSKNLKAIVVDGTKGIHVADPKRFMELVEGLNERFMKDPLREEWTRLGLFFVMPIWASAGHIPTKNHRELISPEEAEVMVKRFGADEFLKRKTRTLSCVSCMSGDKAAVELKEGAFTGLTTLVSTTMSLSSGAGMGMPDMNWSTKYFDIFNRAGLDMMTFHSVLDWAVDLYENGVITKEDTGGIELRRGMGYDATVKLIEMTLNREGFGEILGGGWLAAIAKIGRGCEKYAIHIKGTEPDFDARSSFGVEALGQVTNPRGGHDMPVGGLTVAVGREPDFFKRVGERMGFPTEAWERLFVPPGFNVGRMLVHYEHWAEVLNCLGICFRMQSARLHNIDTCAQLYTAATGMEMTPEELTRGAERAFNIYKALNAREGFSRKDDKFPERWVNEPLKRGEEEIWITDYFKTKRVTTEDVERVLDDYYEERGWDVESGIPTRWKLQEMGMKDVADDLERMGLLK